MTCHVCGLTVNSEGDRLAGLCFLHIPRKETKPMGGKDLPLVSATHDHRGPVIPNLADEVSELYVTSGMVKDFQTWHDEEAPIHPLCSNCDVNRPFPRTR
jgi:hypothetical protein